MAADRRDPPAPERRPEDTHDQVTATFGLGRPVQPELVRRFRLTVAEGPEVGKTVESNSDVCSIGSHELNALCLEDSTVSRFHCEVRLSPEGAVVHDLGSRNGTILDGVAVKEAFLRGGSLLRLGRAVVRFDFCPERNKLPLSENTAFGSLVGASLAMRSSFAVLERTAPTDATVLLEGETGTGKGQAAESIHRASPRRDKPFVVVDCSAIPANLLESELFGHEKGAFTGAAGRRVGAFEEADGGTIFLDEIGELPAELQPKLLRVLESREFRRVGGTGVVPVDVRIIAATNRDLRAEVNAGRFRSDLFYRLAVVKVALPPLRARPEDLPVLLERLLAGLGADAERAAPLRSPEFLATLQRSAWPGNVRELRNHLERCLVLEDALPLPGAEASTEAQGAAPVDARVPYAEARRRALDEFERRYIEALMQLHGGKVSAAARSAGIDRVYLYRLMRRHQLKG